MNPIKGSNYGRADLCDAIREKIREIWLSAGNISEMPQIGEDDNLFDLGVVDSLTMVEVIDFLERISGDEPLDLLSVNPELFFTLRGACTVVQQRLAAREHITSDAPDVHPPTE